LASDLSGLVRLWSVPDGAVARDLAPAVHGTSLTVNMYGLSATFSPDGQHVAGNGVDWDIGMGSGVVAIWSATDGHLERRLASLGDGNLGWVGWSPTDKVIVAGSMAGGLRVWCLDETAPAIPPAPPIK
jgi:hypothetical protein